MSHGSLAECGYDFSLYYTLCLRKKRANFEMVYLKIVTIDFDDTWQKYSH